MTNKFQFTKFGLTENPIGLVVALPWKDSKGDPRTLLGEVVAVSRNDVRGMLHLSVRHFNGEMWPVEPVVSAVEIVR